MPIIKCANCNKEYEIDTSLEGKKVKCSKCENTFVIEFSKNNDSIEKKEEDNTIKPNKMSYMLLGTPILFFSFITIIISLISLTVGIIFLVINVLIYFWYDIKYKKELLSTEKKTTSNLLSFLNSIFWGSVHLKWFF